MRITHLRDPENPSRFYERALCRRAQIAARKSLRAAYLRMGRKKATTAVLSDQISEVTCPRCRSLATSA